MCGGGTEEWPPAVEIWTRTSRLYGKGIEKGDTFVVDQRPSRKNVSRRRRSKWIERTHLSIPSRLR